MYIYMCIYICIYTSIHLSIYLREGSKAKGPRSSPVEAAVASDSEAAGGAKSLGRSRSSSVGGRGFRV